MNDQEWTKLCKNIFEKKCILFLGSEFPLEIKEDNLDRETSFSQLLSEKIFKEFKEVSLKIWNDRYNFEPPAGYFQRFEGKEFTQLANDYINSTECDKKLCRENMELMVGSYLDDIAGQITSTSFDKLGNLPFTFIVDANYSNFFFEQLKKCNKSPRKAYYDFRGDRIDMLNMPSEHDESLGTEMSPFVYNLLGATENTSSMVISENDMIQFIINIISKNPGLPADVKTELSQTDTCFLFMGFGMKTKNWYFRILLNVLESASKERMSYALECIDNADNSHDPVVMFFLNELKVSLCNCNNREFISTLATKYAAYEQKRVNRNKDIAVPADAPKAFISYKSEDYTTVNEIYKRLRVNGIDAWLDKERLTGKWSEVITNEIQNSNAFVLIQSKNLKNSPVNYVNAEIKEALVRAKYYQREEDYFFPSYIDSSESVLSSPEILGVIQSVNLSSVELIDRLSKDIKRSYERNKTIKSNSSK